MVAVFFIYGLSFFILGFAITLYPKRQSRFWLAKNVWPVAAFSFLHGLNEWADMFIIIEKPFNIEYLNVLKTVLLPASFIFLLHFGANHLSVLKQRQHWPRMVPVFFLVLWAFIVASSNQKQLMADIWARYLLAVPGILLTSFALMTQKTEIKKFGLVEPLRYLKLLSLGFLLYSFFSGFIVPDAGFFPASVFNYSTFIDIFSVPVQVFRALIALFIAYCMIKLLEIFDLETKADLIRARDNLDRKVKERTLLLVHTNKELEREIKERIHSGEMLREERNNIKKYLEVAGVIIVVIDPDQTVRLINRKGCELLGYDEEEITGRNWFDMVIPESCRGQVKAVFDSLMAGEIEHSEYFENPVLTRNGEKRIIAWNNSLLLDNDGLITGTISSGEDITDRREAENAIRESEKRYRDLFENANDSIFIVDSELRYIDVNKKAVELTGFSKEEFQKMNILDMVPPEQVPRSKKEFARLKRKESYEKFVGKLRTKDGRWLDIEVSSSPIIKDGTVIGSRDIVRDISERMRLEEQLIHAQKMEAVGQLAGGVAHDFNNILTAIIGYGNLMQMKMDENDPLRKNINAILSSAERASHLVHSLLVFSRKQVMQSRPVHLNDIIRNVENILSRVLPEDIEFVTRLSPYPLTVWADSGQMEQVLVNLAANARDAMPDGGQFTIETEAFDLDDRFREAYGYGRPGRYVLLSVMDNGEGMEKETLERIFDPFFTTKEVGKGTGLGLSMVYGIIKQHGGYINVSSEPGTGTTFRIYLPLIRSKDEEGQEEEASVPKGGTETILVAEDNEETRILISEVLTLSGYSVIEATDGEDAVRKFTDHQDGINLLILDVIMPKKNGKEVYDEIRKTDPDIKALFLSGYTADIVQRKGIFDEGLHFIHKPISRNQLLLVVRNALEETVSGS